MITIGSAVEPRLSEPLGAAGGSNNRNVRIIEIGVFLHKTGEILGFR